MKRIAIFTVSAMLAISLTACAHKTVPLPAWAPNANVAVVGSTISAANATVFGYEKDQADCAAKPTLVKCPGVSNPATHSAIQTVQHSLTIAQPEYNLWVALIKVNPDSPEPANLAAAISTIQLMLSKLAVLTK